MIRCSNEFRIIGNLSVQKMPILKVPVQEGRKRAGDLLALARGPAGSTSLLGSTDGRQYISAWQYTWPVITRIADSALYNVSS